MICYINMYHLSQFNNQDHNVKVCLYYKDLRLVSDVNLFVKVEMQSQLRINLRFLLTDITNKGIHSDYKILFKHQKPLSMCTVFYIIKP